MPSACPRCGAALAPGPEETASCPRGHGVWIASPAMRDALARLEADAAPAREGDAGCPSCDGPLRILTVPLPDGAQVEIDPCPRCRGAWLDEGEAARVRRATRPGSPLAQAGGDVLWGVARAAAGILRVL